MNLKTGIGIVDDHNIFVSGLSELINGFSGFKVVTRAVNGEELERKLKDIPEQPDIILVDVSMPIMDGPKTVTRLAKLYPDIKWVALSSKDDYFSVMQMIRAGCRAYLTKDIHEMEFQSCLEDVSSKGYYHNDYINSHIRRLIRDEANDTKAKLTPREATFLCYSGTDLTYKEIAREMGLSERTIDGYRDALFGKLEVRSRQGMVMEALKRGLIGLTLDQQFISL